MYLVLGVEDKKIGGREGVELQDKGTSRLEKPDLEDREERLENHRRTKLPSTISSDSNLNMEKKSRCKLTFCTVRKGFDPGWGKFQYPPHSRNPFPTQTSLQSLSSLFRALQFLGKRKNHSQMILYLGHLEVAKPTIGIEV